LSRVRYEDFYEYGRQKAKDKAPGAILANVARRLGEPTPAKRWLVRLYLRRVRRLQENGEQFAQLVGYA